MPLWLQVFLPTVATGCAVGIGRIIWFMAAITTRLDAIDEWRTNHDASVIAHHNGLAPRPTPWWQ